MSEQNGINRFIQKLNLELTPFTQFADLIYTKHGQFGREWSSNWRNESGGIELVTLLNVTHIFERSSSTVEKFFDDFEIVFNVPPHNNLRRIYGITNDQERDTYFLILEYVKGESLSSYLKNNQDLPWSTRLNIAREIVEGIRHLHSFGVAHRDLNSDLIIVCTEETTAELPQVKITGLGLEYAAYDPALTKTLFSGITAYIEPKFLENPNFKKSSKSDIYGIAVILWELSSGRKAFSDQIGQGIFTLTANIIKGEREKSVGGEPSGYVDLYQSCWLQDPGVRPTIDQVSESLDEIIRRQSTGNNEDEIEEVQEEISVHDEEPESTQKPGKKKVKRKKSKTKRKWIKRIKKLQKKRWFKYICCVKVVNDFEKE